MIEKHVLERMIDMVTVAGDETRYTLNGVRLESTGNMVTLMACNGHVLVTRTIEGKCPEGIYFLFKSDVPAVKLVLKECKNISDIECSIDSTGGLFFGQFTKAKIGKQGFESPDFEQVIPNHTNPVAICFDAEYVLAVAKILKDGEKRGSRHIRMVFDPLEPLKPILLQGIDAENFTSVLMPVRDKGTENIRDAYAESLEGKATGGAA